MSVDFKFEKKIFFCWYDRQNATKFVNHCVSCIDFFYLSTHFFQIKMGRAMSKKDLMHLRDAFIHCMVFNAVFNNISVISRRPMHLSMLSLSSLNQYSSQYSFPITIVETTDSDERGMNPVAMTIISPRKEYSPSRGLNQ